MSQGRRRSVHRETFTLTRGDFFGESVVSILKTDSIVVFASTSRHPLHLVSFCTLMRRRCVR